jgi:hypothetical protein
MKPSEFETRSSRRAFLKKGALATGAAVIGAGLFGANQVALGQDSGGSLTKGDIAILRFLAAAEFNRERSVDAICRVGGAHSWPGSPGGKP